MRRCFWCFWLLTASKTSEVMNDYAHVITQDICRMYSFSMIASVWPSNTSKSNNNNLLIVYLKRQKSILALVLLSQVVVWHPKYSYSLIFWIMQNIWVMTWKKMFMKMITVAIAIQLLWRWFLDFLEQIWKIDTISWPILKWNSTVNVY